jgi:hypothetical protein
MSEKKRRGILFVAPPLLKKFPKPFLPLKELIKLFVNSS